MPIYEYACDSCKKRSSALLRRYDDPDPACPHCGAGGLRRLVSSFATTRTESDDLGDSDLGGDDEGLGGGEDELGDFDDDF